MPTDDTSDIPKLAEHLFRHESGKLVSALVGSFGIRRLQLAEDVVQEALIRALETWPFHGIPANPAAWLMQTAKNRALDLIRREKRFHEKLPEITASIERLPESDGLHDDEIRDNRLRLIFACCHPALPPDDRTVLALKTLCGFGVAEIARAFLSSEAAIGKRLTRAKQRIRDEAIPFEIPENRELAGRIDAVLHVLYLLFNEGYKASAGESIVRADLCHEAIRLAGLLAAHPDTDSPRLHALLALMLLNAARLPARASTGGDLLRLRDQDRSLWDRAMIARGLFHLSRSATGNEFTEYHLQAGIAAHHATAESDSATDWPAILRHYDQWIDLNDSPLITLNRAVALSKVAGPQAALDALEPLRESGKLDDYHLFHAVLGDIAEQLDEHRTAARHFQKALELASVSPEQAFLAGRLQECRELTD